MQPLYLYPILFRPAHVERRLRDIEAAGLVEKAPNTWQVCLGILRMWHRVLYRSETIGMCQDNPVRKTWRARLMLSRPLRAPFLLREKAIAPLDFSGLLSSPERVIRHLLAAHHEGVQFVYDLEILSAHPGKLEEALRRAEAVVDGSDPRAPWLRDLVVYDGYHENLVAALRRAVDGHFDIPAEQADNPDIDFIAYLEWCARQPATPAETLQAYQEGRFTLDSSPEFIHFGAAAA